MNRREKQEYLQDYEALKKKGKPFFPYAVLKDSTMALIVVALIVFMSIYLGAEKGPKADPTTTTYTPRPEWYFFFLFELLRVIKPAALTPLATIGIPTICMVLLLLLPFYDRGPERAPWKRPIATTTGILVIIAMAWLTYLGATAGTLDRIEEETAPQYERGKLITAESGCLACHAIGDAGVHGGLGPDLSDIGANVPREAIKRSVAIGPGIMPSFQGLGEENLNAVADYLASLQTEH